MAKDTNIIYPPGMKINVPLTSCNLQGGSPGLVVMGDDSCLRGCGFENRHRILNGHFFTLICCKNRIVCLKRLKINKKRPGLAH